MKTMIARHVNAYLFRDPDCHLVKLQHRIRKLEDEVSYWRHIAVKLGNEMLHLRHNIDELREPANPEIPSQVLVM